MYSMGFAILLVGCLGLIGAAVYFFLKSRELATQFRAAAEAWDSKEDAYASELAKFEKITHIPDIIERARRTNADVEAKLAEAERRAYAIVQQSVQEAQERSRKVAAETEQLRAHAQERIRKVTADADQLRADAREALQTAKRQAQAALEEAQKEAKELASKARKEAKEKREKSDRAMLQALNYSQEIRQKADRRAEEIAGEAYKAKGKLRDYELAIEALQNKIANYEGVYLIPESHILDELAADFGFDHAGSRLKLARERTKLMRERGRPRPAAIPTAGKRNMR
jgi:hypothetical protein